MDKFGVHTASPEGKHGSANAHCPRCGKEARRVGAVLLCPEHGSAPFETSTNGVESVGTGARSQDP